jgi:hypothetical protein
MNRPAARPIASSATGQTTRKGRDSDGARAANDCPLGYPLRISATRLDDICSALGELDWEVLNFVSACRLANGKQLTRQFWRTPEHDHAAARAARRALKRLAGWRVIDPLPVRAVGGLHGGSQTIIYGVGVAGARLLRKRGLAQKRLGTPGDRYVRHTLTVTELVVALHEADRAGLLELIEFQAEPACWRSFIGAFGGLVTLKPDLYVRVALPGSAHEYRAMCEVDMRTESVPTIQAKAERYLSHYRSGAEIREHSVHPQVIWAVTDQRRAEQIAGVLGRFPAPAERLFRVCLLGEVVSILAAEARS